MAPGPQSPIVHGMQERVRRGLVIGNMYIVFFKGNKILAEFTGVHMGFAIMKASIEVNGIMTTVNFVYAARWVFELHEATALLN